MYKFFELIVELIGWLKIFISPTLLGAIIGLLIIENLNSKLGIYLGITIFISGILIGIIWATRIFKSKKGTHEFLSRTMATPELDEKVK